MPRAAPRSASAPLAFGSGPVSRAAGWGPAPAHLDPQALPTSTHHVGEVIGGRYRLERSLGRGGLTEAWAATHVELERPVAIKFLHPEELGAGGGERMLTEARSVARIRHPHVVEFSDFGRTVGGEPFLVMELLDGMPLSAILESRDTLPWARAVSIAKQVASALTAAHQQGVVHRDLRPANVFCVATDEVGDFVKVVDFGLARGSVLGESVSYMSPEQCLGAQLDPRSDVYALGCLMFKMITGDPPFVYRSSGGGNAAQIAAQHQSKAPKFLSERAPRQFISEELEAVVAQCLAKDPSQRFADTAQLALELGRIAQAAAAASIAGAPIIRDPNPGDSVSLPMTFAGGRTPKAPRSREAPAPAAERPASTPTKKKGSPLRVAAGVLGATVLVGGAGVGMYSLVSMMIADVEDGDRRSADEAEKAPKTDETDEAAERGSDAATSPALAPGEGRGAAEGPGSEAAPASVPEGGAPDVAEPDSDRDRAPAEPSEGSSAKPAPKPGEGSESDPSPEAKPTATPDSKAGGVIGHEDLEDPWG